ncbi:MAG: spondin domain-containing protein [Dokdonia sp.]|jgi:hypothetical protein
MKRSKILLLCLLITVTFLTSTAQEIAQYRLSFTSNWSQQTHPHSSGSLPSQAHWSPFVVAIHSDQVDFLSMGAPASQGVQNIAEIGNANVFLQEVEAAVTAGNAQEGFQAGDIDDALGSIDIDIALTQAHPMVTVLSMIAPSPDWFVALDSHLLYDGTEWINEQSIDVYAYDAGTDSGVDYTSANSPTTPAEAISTLEGITPFSFEKIGTFSLILTDVLSVSDNTQLQTSIYPNPASHFTLRNPEQDKLTLSIYNVLGQMVFRAQTSDLLTRISLEGQNPGIYFLKGQTPDGRHFTERLIKQ